MFAPLSKYKNFDRRTNAPWKRPYTQKKCCEEEKSNGALQRARAKKIWYVRWMHGIPNRQQQQQPQQIREASIKSNLNNTWIFHNSIWRLTHPRQPRRWFGVYVFFLSFFSCSISVSRSSWNALHMLGMSETFHWSKQISNTHKKLRDTEPGHKWLEGYFTVGILCVRFFRFFFWFMLVWLSLSLLVWAIKAFDVQ